MINSFTNKQGEKFKYWIDEIPDAHFIPKQTLNQRFQVREAFLRPSSCAAIEVYLHSHCSSYGLLGFEYFSEPDQDFLTIEMQYCDKLAARYSETIAFNGASVFVGCLEREAKYSMDSILLYLRDQAKLPLGKLCYSVAAYCEIRSSPAIFSMLAKILIDILLSEERYTSAEIERMLRDYLQ